MPTIWLEERLCTRGDLPDVCMKCGQPTTNRMNKSFSWMPGVIYVALIFGVIGLVVFLILAAVLRKTIKAQVPMCDQHKNHWMIRLVLVLLGLGVLIGVIVLVVVSMSAMPSGQAKDMMPLLIVAAILAWLIGAIVSSVTSIRALEIKPERGLKLGGVCQEFIDAYEEEFERGLDAPVDREALERWDDRRERRSSRPSGSRDGDRYHGDDEEKDPPRRPSRDRDRDDY